MKKTRKFQPGLDSLEPRTVLSTAHPAAQVTTLHGTGTMTTTGATTLSGATQATVAMAGKFARLGNSTGTLAVTVPTGNLNFTATGTITTADGDTIDISFAGGSQTPRSHATRAVGQFLLNITGGTGAFANTSGIGKITVVQNLVTGKETFTVNAKVVDQSAVATG